MVCLCPLSLMLLCVLERGSHLCMRQKELAADHGVLDLSCLLATANVKDHRGKEGSTLGLGTPGMTLEGGPF